MPFRLLLLLIFAGLSSCEVSHANHVEGIYYWKTSWSLDKTAQNEIQAAGLKRVYLRLFDYDHSSSSGVHRRGELRLPKELDTNPNLSFIPVIFITNTCWGSISDPLSFAENLLSALDRYQERFPALARSGELQIDCDWTPTTREAYFKFLHGLKAQRPDLNLSVTVRLHQYREREQNGIPPADRGMLMCYNMAPVQDPRTVDAIYDPALLSGYLKAPTYPLSLDAGLPLFSWGAAFRGKEFLGLTDPPDRFGTDYLERLAADSTSGLLIRDTVISNIYLRPGDVIRGDGMPSKAALREAKKLLRTRKEIETILYFDWQPGALELLSD